MTKQEMQSVSRYRTARPLIGGLLLAALLSACGGNSGGSAVYPADTASPSPAQPAKSLKEQIADVERSGKYPTLDRSSDIAGPDVNQNGVRDDIEAWINAQPVTEPQRKALMQKAKALQRTLIVDLTDKEALQQVGEATMAATNCGGDSFESFGKYYEVSGKIEAMTANTRERAMRYMQYSKARSGSITTLPDHDTCEP
jgi:hypothetical protein